MERIVHFNIEGAEFDVPLYYDEDAKRELEHLPDLVASPIHTPAGERVMLTIEDACPPGAPADGDSACVDCGSCRYYRQTPGTLFGVCGHARMRAGADRTQPPSREKEETT